MRDYGLKRDYGLRTADYGLKRGNRFVVLGPWSMVQKQ